MIVRRESVSSHSPFFGISRLITVIHWIRVDCILIGISTIFVAMMSRWLLRLSQFKLSFSILSISRNSFQLLVVHLVIVLFVTARFHAVILHVSSGIIIVIVQ